MTTQPSNWGGARQGVQGRGYVNRTDLMQGPRTGSPQAAASPTTQGAQYVPPDALPNLADPSGDSRPLTDGLPMGPGAGPEALAPAPDLSQDRTMLTLQMLYEQTGSPFLLRLMSRQRGIQIGMRARR